MATPMTPDCHRRTLRAKHPNEVAPFTGESYCKPEVVSLFQRTDSAGARSFLTDALGSTLSLADNTGTIQTSYSFDPFGSTTTSGSISSNSFVYTGREMDGINLLYYRARYYNPAIQRFISEDPIGLKGGVNPYQYASGNPISLSDPHGTYSSNNHYFYSYDAAIAAGYSIQQANQIAMENIMTDFAPTFNEAQSTDAFDANMHAMAGRKPNGNMQDCKEALQGTTDRLRDSLMAGELGPALHTIQDMQASGHQLKDWTGSVDYDHEIGDWFPTSENSAAAYNMSLKFLTDYRNGTIDADLGAYLQVNGGSACH
jgi:RHS repeat-associated protein